MRLMALTLSAGIAGCGARAATTPHQVARTGVAAAGATLIHAPAVVGKVCGKLVKAVDFPIMCPSAWPRSAAASEPQVGVFATTRATYLVNAFNGLSDHGPHIFHLFFGGQASPFRADLTSIDPSLRVTTHDVRIPMRGGRTYLQQRAAHDIGSTTVHRQRARILQEPPYPQGGLHGGHVLVLWNQSGHGYLVSVHGQGLARPTLIAAAVAFADSTSPVPAATAG
jgi:hypothetical protein